MLSVSKPLMIDLDEANDLLEVSETYWPDRICRPKFRYFEPARRQRQDYLEGKHGELEP